MNPDEPLIMQGDAVRWRGALWRVDHIEIESGHRYARISRIAKVKSPRLARSGRTFLETATVDAAALLRTAH